ncbi:MAG TPA: enoyl-CoA hydratase [Sphingomicrobium sp.]|nr:enoyl-CoA hydratase [Sphingomicrobium sp.]
MNEHIRVERDGGILAITLARPERRNAITVAMYAALADAIEEAASDPGIRVITICGEGQDFAAGNDLGDFLNALPRDTTEIPVWRFLRALATCETPIVAGVQGNCVGIGTTMLLHCDLVIADETARFSLPFVDLALVPEAASSLLFPRLAGRRGAARHLLLCEPFGVEEAQAMGLISHRANPGMLRSRLDEVLAALLAKPPEALKQTQRLLRHGLKEEVLDRMELESSLFAERLQSSEVKEAISAFFEKRKPNF